MRSFASDNNSSVHPRIMEALMKANNGHALGYGDDPWTEEAAHKVKEQFSRPCEALFVFNGTGTRRFPSLRRQCPQTQHSRSLRAYICMQRMTLCS